MRMPNVRKHWVTLHQLHAPAALPSPPACFSPSRAQMATSVYGAITYLTDHNGTQEWADVRLSQAPYSYFLLSLVCKIGFGEKRVRTMKNV